MESVLGQWRSATWLVIFFGLVLSLKLQIELVGFTDRKRFTRPSGKASENQTSILKVFLLSVCVVIFVTRPVGDFRRSLGYGLF